MKINPYISPGLSKFARSRIEGEYENAAYLAGHRAFERHICYRLTDIDDLNPYLPTYLRNAWNDGWHHAYQAYWIDAAEYAE